MNKLLPPPASAAASSSSSSSSDLALTHRPVRLTGRAAAVRDPLRSPVSGAECIYWRLRIVEELEPTLRLVHEVASSEPFELLEADEDPGQASTARVRIAPAASDIRAPAVLHRPGSPGAVAAGRHFELLGALMVEEILVRPGELLVADGVLEDRDAGAAPFRATADERELLGALVRLPGRNALGPVLLPWALGTAAALLGGMGAATWAATHFDLFPRLRQATTQPLRAAIRPVRFERRHFSQP